MKYKIINSNFFKIFTPFLNYIKKLFNKIIVIYTTKNGFEAKIMGFNLKI